MDESQRPCAEIKGPDTNAYTARFHLCDAQVVVQQSMVWLPRWGGGCLKGAGSNLAYGVLCMLLLLLLSCFSRVQLCATP